MVQSESGIAGIKSSSVLGCSHFFGFWTEWTSHEIPHLQHLPNVHVMGCVRIHARFERGGTNNGQLWCYALSGPCTKSLNGNQNITLNMQMNINQITRREFL